MSCVASALPANSLSTYPPRINWHSAGPLPVCTIAGPPTTSVLPPPRRLATRSRAISRTSAPLGFSVETPLDMKLKSLCTRVRSTGITRTPAWPVTIGMPRRTSIIGMQRAAAEGVGCRVSGVGFVTDT